MKVAPAWLAMGRGPGYSAIGFSILEDAINLVQLRMGGDSPVISAAALLDVDGDIDQLLENPKHLKRLLAPALKEGFVGRKVYSCLPAEHYRLLYVNYKESQPGEGGAAILNQIKDRLDGPLSEFVVDYMPIRANAKNEDQLALVSVAERGVVIDYLERLRRAGLNVDALEIAPVAINRLLAAVAAPDNYHNSISVSFGRYKSSLSVFSGRRLILDREVLLGERDIIQQLCRSLDVDESFARRMLRQQVATPAQTNAEDEARNGALPATVGQILKPLFLKLSNEIEKATAYAASQTRGEPIRQLFLLGAASEWPLAHQVLGEIVKLPVHVLSPVASYEPLQDFLGVPPELSDSCLPLSCGLALRGWAG